MLQYAVAHQGHGFQRALLVAALTVLSNSRRIEGQAPRMLLAIEEPELFHHPTQAKAFASVLRSLADAPARDIQVAYATHSPYFVEPRYFDQLRRVTRLPATDDQTHPQSRITRATMDDVCNRLTGFMREDSVRRRFAQVCYNDL